MGVNLRHYMLFWGCPDFEITPRPVISRLYGNLILKYFNNINETTIQCSICFKNYLKPFHTDTIRKHFSIKHKEINDQIRNRIQSTGIPPDNNNRIQSTRNPPDNNNKI